MIDSNSGSIDDFAIEVSPANDSPRSLKDFPTVSNSSVESSENKFVNSQWLYTNKNVFSAISATVPKLPAGFYTFSWDQRRGWLFEKRQINIDEILTFPNSITDKIISEIQNFWELKPIFEAFKFLHRRGYLLYGPQGSGKSIVVQQIISDIIRRDGVAFSSNLEPSQFDQIIRAFRQVEPYRNIVCIFEDIDAIISTYGEDELLSLLDGENQVNQVLNIATTNYPEKLDKRIISRPRRFDRIIKINNPDSATRKLFFERKLKISGEELDRWVSVTDGFSFASLTELIISTKCLQNDFDTSVEILKQLTKRKSSDEFQETLGFK